MVSPYLSFSLDLFIIAWYTTRHLSFSWLEKMTETVYKKAKDEMNQHFWLSINTLLQMMRNSGREEEI